MYCMSPCLKIHQSIVYYSRDDKPADPAGKTEAMWSQYYKKKKKSKAHKAGYLETMTGLVSQILRALH